MKHQMIEVTGRIVSLCSLMNRVYRQKANLGKRGIGCDRCVRWYIKMDVWCAIQIVQDADEQVVHQSIIACCSVEVVARTDGTVEATLPAKQTGWVAKLLLRLGPDAEVLDPPELRTEISEIAAAALDRYGR